MLPTSAIEIAQRLLLGVALGAIACERHESSPSLPCIENADCVVDECCELNDPRSDAYACLVPGTGDEAATGSQFCFSACRQSSECLDGRVCAREGPCEAFTIGSCVREEEIPVGRVACDVLPGEAP